MSRDFIFIEIICSHQNMYYVFCREVRGAKLVCHRKPLRGLTALGKDTCT